MANISRKYIVEKNSFSIDGFKYNVQVWLSIDGGESYWYTGVGRFVKTKKEARQYIQEYKKNHRTEE